MTRSRKKPKHQPRKRKARKEKIAHKWTSSSEPIPHSQLVQVGATTDGEFVMLRWGDAEGEGHSFEITAGRFLHAMQQLSELSARLVAQKRASGGLELSVPLEMVEAHASASLGGQVVFLDFRGEGSLDKVSYRMTAEKAERLAGEILAAVTDAKSQASKPRH